LDKKAPRGINAIKHKKNSGMNFITVMDSKEVSLFSTVAEVEPITNARRYLKDAKSKVEIGMSYAISIYNSYMDRVDLQY